MANDLDARDGPAGAHPPASLLPPVIAHRGASIAAPENTLAAFQRAADLGARAVEFDVKLSADGVPVVIHDDTVDRTTNATGTVVAFTAAALAALDAGSWFDPAFAGQGVPTLAATLALLAAAGLTYNLELKPDAGADAGTTTTAAALAVATDQWPASLQPPVISSFDTAALQQARAAAPAWPRALLVRDGSPDHWLAEAARLHCVAIHANQRLLDDAAIAAVTDAGFALGAFTVNTPSHARTLWARGVAYIFTGDPAAMLADGAG